jgi:hypothetical protein
VNCDKNTTITVRSALHYESTGPDLPSPIAAGDRDHFRGIGEAVAALVVAMLRQENGGTKIGVSGSAKVRMRIREAG